MSFWVSELGDVTGKEADAFAKSFKQIPDGTMALARIESFANAEYQGFKYLAIDWQLIDGDFKGQKIVQKLKVFGGDSYDKDPLRTKHRALNMFKLLYQLFSIKPKHNNAPSDEDLSLFVGKVAGIKIRETEPNDQGKQYNWVAEVHDAKGFKCETGVSVIVTQVKKSEYPGTGVESALTRNAYYSQDPGFSAEEIPF